MFEYFPKDLPETGPHVWLKLWGIFDEERKKVLDIRERKGQEAAEAAYQKAYRKIGAPGLWARVFSEGIMREPTDVKDIVESTRDALHSFYTCLNQDQDDDENNQEVLIFKFEAPNALVGEEELVDHLTKIKENLAEGLRQLKKILKRGGTIADAPEMMQVLAEYDDVIVSYQEDEKPPEKVKMLLDDITVILSDVKSVFRGLK